MVSEEQAAPRRMVIAAGLYSLPNKLTTLRLGLAIVLFFFIWLQWWATCLVVFALAAFTDWLDGQVARRRGLISPLGRVYDPLVDKVLVCGVFIFLGEIHGTGLPGDAGLSAFMVTIIVAREFIVTGLRGFLEQHGISFGADRLGKIKMVLQCVAIIGILLGLALAERGLLPPGYPLLRDLLNWTAVLVTFWSGANYIWKALECLE